METLKLTTFAMLIPLGWAISTDAYPQPLERSDPSPALNCHTAQRPDSASETQKDDAAAINEVLAAIEAKHSTSALHETRTSPTDTYRLEFDPIEID